MIIVALGFYPRLNCALSATFYEGEYAMKSKFIENGMYAA